MKQLCGGPLCGLLLLCGSTFPDAAALERQSSTLVVRGAQPSASVSQRLSAQGKSAYLQRTAEVLDAQLIEVLNQKQLFQVIAQPVEAPKLADAPFVEMGGTFQLAPTGANYVLLVTLTDLYQEQLPLLEGQTSANVLNNRRNIQLMQQAQLQALRSERDRLESLWRRSPRGANRDQLQNRLTQLNAQLRIAGQYTRTDQSTAANVNFEKQTKVRSSVRLQANFRLLNGVTGAPLVSQSQTITNSEIKSVPASSLPTLETNEELLFHVSRLAAQWIADAVFDFAHPAAVLEKTEDQVTINRGQNGNIKVGHTYRAFTAGKEFLTSAGTVRDRVLVGKVKIESVGPLVSKGRILEDNGVVIGAVLTR